MTPAQITVTIVGACLGLALIALGVTAFLKPGFLASARRSIAGLPPALVLFGITSMLLAWNVVVLARSEHRSSLQWWFVAENGGPLSGLLGNPAIASFMLGILVLAWWPRDSTSPARFFARLKSQDQRPLLIWEIARVLVTLVVAIAVMVGAFALLVSSTLSTPLLWLGGFLTLFVLWGAGLAAWWLYSRLIPRPRRQSDRS